MLGTGIMALADYLRLPEIYESYGDTNVDRLTNPLLYKDAGRVPVNAFLDATTFIGDLVGDIPAAAYDKAMATEFYNPLSKEGQERNLERSKGFLPYIPGVDFQMNPLTEKGMDTAANVFSEFTGLPSFTKDNPAYDPSLGEQLQLDTSKTINSKYNSKFDNAEKIANDYINENAATMDRYFTVNPGNTYEDYDAYLNDMFQEKLLDEQSKFEDDYYNDYNDLFSQNSQAMFGYDLSDPEAALLGPGARKFNFGNIAGTDIPLKYAADGEYFLPFMEYEGPNKEDLERLTFMTEVGAGGIQALRGLGKRFVKNKSDRISPELQDAVDEYMRD
jgi:hypothetical protein